MAAFRQLDEARLMELDDAELIEYVLDARAAGNEEQAELALRIFAFGMEDALRAFVRSKLTSLGDTVIEEIAGRALEDAIRSISKLAGGTPQEARAFVFKIARRRVADFLRRGRVSTTPIDDDERHGSPDQQARLSVGGESDLVDTSLLIDQLLRELREDHRTVVELYVLSGYSARDTVDQIRSRDDGRFDDSISEQNVHQIASRFRRDLRARLEEGGEAVI